jgi:hypothetical protein
MQQLSPITASTIVDAHVLLAPALPTAGDSYCGGLTGGRVAGLAAAAGVGAIVVATGALMLMARTTLAA